MATQALFIIYWFFLGNYEYVLLLTVTFILTSFIFISPKRTVNQIIKYFIAASAGFSILVIVQAVIKILNPSVFYVDYNPTYALKSTFGYLPITYPIHYLGFWASGVVKILGIEMYRFQSFASEPSILVSLFVIPGLIGLTYDGITIKLSYLILFFSVVLASSGTIYLSIAFGVTVFLVLSLTKYVRLLNISIIRTSMILFSITFVVFLIVFNGVDIITSVLDRYFNRFSEMFSILGHVGHKSELRVISSQEAFKLLINNPLGARESFKLTVTGLLLNYGLIIGIPGVLFGVLIFKTILVNLFKSFNFEKSLKKRFAIALLAGTIIQILTFSGYGFVSASGFIIIAIIYIWSNQLPYKESGNF